MKWIAVTDHKLHGAAARIVVAALVALMGTSCAVTAVPLPTNEPEFDEVVRVWVRPGDSRAESVSLLESRRFDCRQRSDNGATRCRHWRWVSTRPQAIRVYTVDLVGDDETIDDVVCHVRLTNKRPKD